MSNVSKGFYRPDIDGLRAVAVVPVVLHHAGVAGVPGGFVGVDIFFVISGFLITSILASEIQEGRFSILSFYERRARRILPALFAVLVVCLVVGWFLLLPDQYDDLAKSTGATLLFVSNVWFWLDAGDYFGRGVELAPLLHTWSLAVEEQFYLFFPLLLWGLARFSRQYWIGAIALISFLSLGLSTWATTAHPVGNFYLSPTRVWELGIGALLAIGAFPVLRRPVAIEAVALFGLIMIAGSILIISDHTPFPGLMAVPPCLGAAFLIWAGMHGGSMATRVLSLRPMVWVGLISYSLYLWHWPVLVAARVQYGRVDLSTGTALICVVLSVLLATASLFLIERPFRVSAIKGGYSRCAIFVGAGTGVALILAAAGTLVLKEGFPDRIPPDLAQELNRFKTPHDLMYGCIGWSEDQDPCPIGTAPGEQSVGHIVVWGDSHAGALLSGIDLWLTDHNISGQAFVKLGCPPLMGIRRADMPAEHACDVHNENVMSYIEQRPDVDAVVVVARWALVTEGVRAPGESGRSAHLAAAGKPPTGIKNNPIHVAQGFERLLQRLKDHDIDVVVVGTIPEIGFNVPNAFAASIAFGTELRTPPTREEFDRRNARAYAILSEGSRKFDAILARPADVLCDASCRILMEGEPIYMDDDHLNQAGANWLVAALLEPHLSHIFSDKQEP